MTARMAHEEQVRKQVAQLEADRVQSKKTIARLTKELEVEKQKIPIPQRRIRLQAEWIGPLTAT